MYECNGTSDRVREVESELRELAALADSGVLAGALVHEFNNFINLITLVVAVLELNLADGARAQVETIRRHANKFRGLVEEFEAHRPEQRLAPRPIDLNDAVLQCLDPQRKEKVDLRLTPHLPQVRAAPGEVKRLIRFLLAGAIGPTRTGPVCVQTEASPGWVILRVTHGEPPLQDGGRLLRFACERLARKLGGKLGGAPGAAVLELPANGPQGPAV